MAFVAIGFNYLIGESTFSYTGRAGDSNPMGTTGMVIYSIQYNAGIRIVVLDYRNRPRHGTSVAGYD
jgi:hypothetical protein